jgi:hypothetical protein
VQQIPQPDGQSLRQLTSRLDRLLAELNAFLLAIVVGLCRARPHLFCGASRIGRVDPRAVGGPDDIGRRPWLRGSCSAGNENALGERCISVSGAAVIYLVIIKNPAEFSKRPNIVDYVGVRAGFDWAKACSLLDGLPGGRGFHGRGHVRLK